MPIRQIISQNIMLTGYDNIKPQNVKTQDHEEYPMNRYYGPVYLCYEETDNKPPTTYGPIIGFNCYKYKSFKDADDGWYKSKHELHNLDIRHTMIPICKWVPEIFHKYILNWKLKKLYWLGGIYTYQQWYKK